MKTIAITGSSGFVGKHLVKALLNEGWSIIEIDIDKNYDLLNENDVKRVPKFDVIVHLAAKSFVPHSFENPSEFYRHNYLCMLNVLELARKNSAKVVFFSSYLYGQPQYLPIDENHPVKPHNPYAQSKLICEMLCEGYHRDFNLSIIIFRPFNIYGPGQNKSFIIPDIINQLKSGVVSLKDPRPKRDYIYIDDVVKAIKLAIKYDKSNYEIFNLGYGKSYSVEEVVKIIMTASKSNAVIEFTNKVRQNEVMDTVSNNAKINSFFMWRPCADLIAGISNYLSRLSSIK